MGDYTYYDDVDGADKFEEHVLYHYEFFGDKLIIGKFCQIASGIKIIMNGANHRMNSITTYPFNLMGNGWEKRRLRWRICPLKEIRSSPYHIAGGNPCEIKRKRFDDELIRYLEEIKWWDWDEKKIFDNLDILCSPDLEKIRRIQNGE